MKFRINDDGDAIILDFPPGPAPSRIEIKEIISSMWRDFMEEDYPDIIDQVFLAFAKNAENIDIQDGRALIHIGDMTDEIRSVSKDFEDIFTARQLEVLIKKFLNISLDSTERSILFQVRKKVKYAKDVLSDLDWLGLKI